MLNNFFQLNPPITHFDDNQLTAHFRASVDLRSVLYQPDDWPSSIRRLSSITFTNVSVSKTKFANCTFTQCQFEDCLFIGCEFVGVEFHRCQFVNCNFYKARFDNCYLDPRTISFDRSYHRSAANVGVSLFQQLYENASKSRQPDFLMEADIEFRRWKRRQLRYDQESGKIRRAERYAKTAASIIYEVLTGFGYRPLRFIVATVIIFTAISVLNMYLLSGLLKQDGTIASSISLPDAIFYTYSMLSVLGFSSIVPDGSFAKIVTVAEALMGVGWLGLFTSLLVKRFIR